MDYFATQVMSGLRSCFRNIAGMPACADRSELINQFLSFADELKNIKDEPVQANTRINYLYRDASNYRTCNSVILGGKIADEQFEEMKACCEDTYEMFIPEQVGLDLIRDWETTEDDHPYAELCDYEYTPYPPTTDMTIAELLEAFRKAKGNWRPEDYEPVVEHYEDEEEEW